LRSFQRMSQRRRWVDRVLWCNLPLALLHLQPQRPARQAQARRFRGPSRTSRRKCRNSTSRVPTGGPCLTSLGCRWTCWTSAKSRAFPAFLPRDSQGPSRMSRLQKTTRVRGRPCRSTSSREGWVGPCHIRQSSWVKYGCETEVQLRTWSYQGTRKQCCRWIAREKSEEC